MTPYAPEQDPDPKDPAQHLASLESTRPFLVRTILDTLTSCTNADAICDPHTHLSTDRQRLLSAAIKDLENLDNQLHQTRNPLQHQWDW